MVRRFSGAKASEKDSAKPSDARAIAARAIAERAEQENSVRDARRRRDLFDQLKVAVR